MAKSRPEDEPGWRWLENPAIFCDTFSVDFFTDSNIFRLAFGEYTDKEHYPYFRVGVALPFADAKALARTLTRLIKEAEEREKVDESSAEN
jgi:hypothetical protein